MKVLLIYPEFPDTFWSFKHALKFISKRAALPPLGLLTIAAMLPKEWKLRLTDTNVCRLTDKTLAWADCVFISAMTVQRRSAKRIISRCKAADIRIVAGGPLFTIEHEKFPDVDHFILNEAELTLPRFLEDLAHNKTRRIYRTDGFADMKKTPAPLWKLLELKRYATMSIQFSRGCPFNCDFCNVTSLFGHRIRIKSPAQIINELEALYSIGWRGTIFFVDDNFIGNKRFLKNELLPALINWGRKRKGYTFITEASINLADDQSLMEQMVEAGFDTVFIGIETPDECCLSECCKSQNRNRDLINDVKRIQHCGLQVQGGFIVGFDHDTPSIFQRQIDFIQKSGIVTAMVGLLQAPAGTRLYRRMQDEGRLISESSGDNVDGTTNIVPLMSMEQLKQGYRRILDYIYSPAPYYQRIRTFLREYKVPRIRTRIHFSQIMAIIRSFYRIGLIGRERLQYWKLIFWTLFRHPRLLPNAIMLAIYGYHFRRVCKNHVKLQNSTPFETI